MRKTFEKWMRADRIGPVPHVCLYLLSLAYSAVVKARLALYRAGVFKQRRLGCKVVSVGNITTGGSGKTPAAIFIAELLKRRGKRPVILSRGYGRKGRGTLIVSDGQTVLKHAFEAGDEPLLMAMRLKGSPVVVGKDRFRAGETAIKRFGPDVIILDDGFQHLRLARDLDIALIDAQTGFGNLYLLPRGILREPLSALKRADCLLIKDGALRAKDAAITTALGIPRINLRTFAARLSSLRDGSDLPLEFLKDKEVHAVSGLANPGSFYRTLEGLGAVVVKKTAFPDHHAYSGRDVKAIERGSSFGDLVITTEKDAVKLKDLVKDIPLHFYCLGIDAAIDDMGAFDGLLKRVME